MSVRIVRLAIAAAVAAVGSASATDPRLPPPPGPTVAHPPDGHRHHGGATHPGVAHAHAGEAGPSHRHSHGDHPHGHCMPGVYRTEVPRFRGNGFVARKRPFTPEMDTLRRAGNPHEVSHLAEPSFDQHYTGYFVGGGASLFKGPGFAHGAKEGTWGWDYEHLGLKRRVNLLFSRGMLYQDGDGQYEADPRFEIPNVFAIRYGERLHRLLGHGGEGE